MNCTNASCSAWPCAAFLTHRRSADRRARRSGAGILRLVLALLPLLSLAAAAQTTTISGTVFDPRTTSSSLPLPSVLVYITTAAVPPLPTGVQCLTYAAPSGVASYTNTAVDGTFTLTKVPENTSYTLVIQAGKWRRQFPVTVTTTPLTGLALHMPSDHTQGDIPLIAVATGSADGAECVLLNMGIAQTEFTDDTGTTNTGGRIHLYQGSGSPGASISPSTPSESALVDVPATLNQYDMVMFPCQGAQYIQTTADETNVTNYANAGGRVFTTHYSYVWLDPDAPFSSQFPPVADWAPGTAYTGTDPAVATVNIDFSDGSILAQWLQDAGASYQNTLGQVQVSTIRHDLQDIIPPTQSWLALNDAADGNPIMQFTFNTPVGAAAGAQCGRVLFNEYHVVNLNNVTALFPDECAGTSSTSMSPQEEMLEYALFDLSAFVKPVVVPSLAITFDPSPLNVKQGDVGDQVTIRVENTSTNTAIDTQAVLSLNLPGLLKPTALTDPAGGWNCTLATLTCTRTTTISPADADSVVLTVNANWTSSGPPVPSALITATVSDPIFSSNVSATDTVLFRQLPTLFWATPAPISYGTPLGAAQLDATASVPGNFVYTPPAGTVLSAGPQILRVVFTPTDTASYETAAAQVTLTVLPITPGIALSASPSPVFATAAVTLTATLGAGATSGGSVSFNDGTSTLGTAALTDGTASMTTTSLAVGQHTITAVYSGAGNYGPATSAPASEIIEDFTVSVAASGTSTVYPGHQADFSVTLSPIGGPTMPAAIDLAVSGLPQGSTANFLPSTVAAQSGATSVTLEVTPSSIGKLERLPWQRTAPPLFFGVILIPFAARLRRARRRLSALLVAVFAMAAVAVTLSGCGINYTPKSFPLTVTASSGALSHTQQLTLTVE